MRKDILMENNTQKKPDIFDKIMSWRFLKVFQPFYEKNKEMLGKTVKILVEGRSKNDPSTLTGRTEGGKIVNFKGNITDTGKFVDIKITDVRTWSLIGETI